MTLYKYIKDGRLYILYSIKNFYMALPYKHSGKPIGHCKVSDFVPMADRA